jgi:hypothetical protein
VGIFDPYAVLGIGRDAAGEEVKLRFRELIREWHPDINGQPDAHERTVAIIEAYEILGDPELRARYDLGPAAFMSWIAEYLAERVRVWQTTECLRCGQPLYGQWRTYERVWDGVPVTERWRWRRRRDALYCSNACRQAAYRLRKKSAKVRKLEP